MRSVKRFCAALLVFLSEARGEPLPAAVVHRPYHHQLMTAGGMSCTGYQPTFQLAGGGLPEGLRLHADGRIAGEPAGAGKGSFAVRITTPCSERLEEWQWTVKGEPMLFVEPAELAFDAQATTATALVSGSWRGLAYSIATADGQPLPPWLRVRPRRGRTPPPDSPFTGDQLVVSVEPSLAAAGASARLLIHTWRGSEPAMLTVRFGPETGGSR